MLMLIRTLGVTTALALVFVAAVEAKPGPQTDWTRPMAPNAAGAIQAGAESANLPAEPAVLRVEAKIRHECFQAPSQGSYSHAVVAQTVNADGTLAATIHWGVIVLASDANNAACPAGLGGGSMGWGRYFYTVHDANGDLLASGLSRAGAANPPPAASSDSGGSPDGYVFAIRRVRNTWKLYFDGIQKYQTGAPGDRIGKAYFLAESSGGASISPARVAHVAFRAWPGGPSVHGGWWQPAGTAFYNPASGFACGALDIERFDNDPADADIDAHWAFAQSLNLGDLGPNTTCNFTDGAQIWPEGP